MTNYYIVDKDVAAELNLPLHLGVWFSKEYTNYIVYLNREQDIVIAEEENDYGEISYNNPQILPLKEGDSLYVRADMSAVTYLEIKQRKVQVVFVLREFEEQTKKFIHSLMQE